MKLWYDTPATQWVEAMPVGNGRIGAMIFGGVEDERLQLNESTLWSGGPVPNSINPGAFPYLAPIRDALLNRRDYSTADSLTKKMQGLYTESYLPMGDLLIHQDFGGVSPDHYYRDLDISTAIAATSFNAGGVTYRREIFTSAPANVLVIRLTSSQRGKLTFTIAANSQLRASASVISENEWAMSGKAPAHVAPNYYNPEGREPVVYEDTNGCSGMRFQFRIKAVVTGEGTVSTDTSGIRVKNATEAIVYLTAATSFNGFDVCPAANGKDEKRITDSLMRSAIQTSYSALRSEHIRDYQTYFNRVSFSLQDTTHHNPQGQLPTNKRLKAYSGGAYDPALETLYFQFGRYLLISSSRPGGPPANLQGIWNKELRAPWSSNYTININTEMNYWPAEPANLPEMHEPLLSFTGELSVTGARIAKEFYHADGWVAHHNSDIWAAANPVGDKGAGDPVWANWPMGGNWLCRHLWEHYAFTRDTEFLKKAYPVMKGAAEFSVDWLVENQNGYLVTAPSTTPENKFIDSTGKEQGVSVGTTMDLSIIRDLFTNVIEAAAVLNIDADFRDTLIAKRSRLLPLQIGSKGQLLEWSEEFKETDPQHRHVSHLFGLYPGREITQEDTAFFKAAKQTLAVRGDGGTGWSRGWKINWWARLLDGDHAYKLIRQLLQYTNTSGTEMHNGGGTYPNLFDAHPPFQIDGNFAGTSGMAEMLLQSHTEDIVLLPALPSAWRNGSVSGLVARGNFVVSMKWNENRLSTVTLFSNKGGECSLLSPVPLTSAAVKTVTTRKGDHYQIKFHTVPGTAYVFQRKSGG